MMPFLGNGPGWAIQAGVAGASFRRYGSFRTPLAVTEADLYRPECIFFAANLVYTNERS